MEEDEVTCLCAMCSGEGQPKTPAEHKARMAQYVEDTKTKIEKHGWICQAVLGTDGNTSWSYTIGLHLMGHPEIVVTNLPHDTAYQLLAACVDMVRKDGKQLQEGQLYDHIVQSFAVKFEPVPDPSQGQWFNVAKWIYGNEPFKVLQLVWPDRDGNFPGQSLYDITMDQPLVGVDE